MLRAKTMQVRLRQVTIGAVFILLGRFPDAPP